MSEKGHASANEVLVPARDEVLLPCTVRPSLPWKQIDSLLGVLICCYLGRVVVESCKERERPRIGAAELGKQVLKYLGRVMYRRQSGTRDREGNHPI
jgi:hypothetical protein